MYYYKADINSQAGKKICAFWRSIGRAEEAAEDLAKQQKAVSWLPPEEHLAGGIDYFEFKEKPTSPMWRTKFVIDGLYQCEPNVNIKADALCIFEKGYKPSDTWNRCYGKEPVSWATIKERFPLEYWQKRLMTVPVLVTAELLEKANFWPYVEFYNDDIKDSNALHRIVRIEKRRRLLPVVDAIWFYRWLEAEMPDGKGGITDSPIFFFEKEIDKVVVKSPVPLKKQGLHEIPEHEYNYRLSRAKKKEQS